MLLALYHLFLLPITLLSLRRLHKERSLGAWLKTIGVVWAAGLVLAVVLCQNRFGLLALLAQLIFVYTPPLFLVGALALRSRTKLLFGNLLLSLLLIAVGVDAFFLEPYWLEVTHLQIETPRLLKPVRIVVLSDIQTDEVTDYERKALKTAASENPDLILLPGDFIQVYEPTERKKQLQKLKEAFIEAGLDKRPMIAVGGNIDASDWPLIFEGFSQTTTLPQTGSLDFGELRIVGLSLEDSFSPSLTVAPSEKFQIVFGHGPDFALSEQVSAQLLVAGHTHGGQVQLPLIGPLMTLSSVPRSWADGATKLSEEKWLSVSRGVGMERNLAPRLRFLCRPEVVVIELVPAR